MKIHYYSYLIRESLYKKLYKKKEKPGMQAQVFNKLIVDGLIKNNVEVKCFSTIPTSKALFDETFLQVTNDKLFKYFKVINIPVIKDLYIFFHTYFYCLKEAKQDNSIVYACDVLCPTSSLAMSLAAKKLNKQCIGIVTDIPELFETNNLFVKMVNKTIQNCSDYIFLTKPMNNYLNKENKPYKIIEGMCEVTEINTNIVREKVFMYAGSIDKVNGINNLVGAFKNIITDYELHIYGDGDYQNELEEICKKHPNIKFFGLTTHSEILNKIKNVSFLINPRGIDNPMVKYSFPSKNMEYMASGTPFLCTKLPCMDEEYFNYINLFENDNIQGIKEGIEKVLKENYDVLLHKAKQGQKFILENKNNKAQTQKILELVKVKK